MRIRDGYPGSRILIFIHPGTRIPDPTTAPKEEGRKTFFSLNIFSSYKYHKILNNFIFEPVKKIFLDKSLRIILYFLPQN